MRDGHARAAWVMHPRSSVAFRIESAAPIENIFVCRRCPVLMSPRTSLDKRAELVSYLTFVPRNGTPSHHGPKHRAAGVEFVGVDPDYKHRRVARSRRSSIYLWTAVVELP